MAKWELDIDNKVIDTPVENALAIRKLANLCIKENWKPVWVRRDGVRVMVFRPRVEEFKR
jgi:hypothetical protein